MKNAKDTDLQRYAVILLLWLKNAAHFRSLFLGTEEALRQLLLRVSFPRSREVLDATTKGWKVKGTAIRDSYNNPEGLRTSVTAITTCTSK